MDGSGNRKEVPMKGGKVNEMCREWLVREDGAFAYHLQAQEISQHYSGNKNRNQQVREDFPCAQDEQLREQQLAEQAAAVYQRMLMEQEEVDEQIARDLAERLEREEATRKLAMETCDQKLARQMHQLQHHRGDKDDVGGRGGREYVGNQPRRQAPQMPLPKSRLVELAVQQRQASNSIDCIVDHVDSNSSITPSPAQPPTIHSKPPPMQSQPKYTHTNQQQQQLQQLLPGSADDYHDLYTEPYQPKSPQPATSDTNVTDQMLKIDIAGGGKHKDKQTRYATVADNLRTPSQTAAVSPQRDRECAPPLSPSFIADDPAAEEKENEDELQRLQQEERDAEFARRLQEEERNSEESIMIRDRMLAMEAQDKELARLLQEREKAKARRAKERAKQRALQKKLALEQHPQQSIPAPDNHHAAMILLPDDSYSNPVDLLPPKTVIAHTIELPLVATPTATEATVAHLDDNDDDAASSNYSLPVDTVGQQQVSRSAVTRPTQLHLRSTTANAMTPKAATHYNQPKQKISKPRYPDPPPATCGASAQGQHTNIAIAIDPTYGRRQQQQMMPLQQQQTGNVGYYQPSYSLQQYYVNGHNGHGSSAGVGHSTLDNSNHSSGSPTPCTPSSAPSTFTTTSSSSSSNTSPLYQQQQQLMDTHHRDSGGKGSPVPPYMPIQGQRRAALNAAIDSGMLAAVCQQQQVHQPVISGGGGGKSRKGKAGKEGGGGGCKQQ